MVSKLDLAKNWRFVDNLPVTKFYKVAVDDAAVNEALSKYMGWDVYYHDAVA